MFGHSFVYIFVEILVPKGFVYDKSYGNVFDGKI